MTEAVVVLRRAVELRPDYSIGYYNLGRALAQAGDLGGAAAAFDSALAADPRSAAAVIARGQTYLDMHQPDKAVEYFNRALAIDPGSSEAFMNMGVVAQQSKDVLGATRLYEQALALNPRNHRAAANLASVYRVMSRWADSRAQSLNAIALDPSSAELRSNYLFGLDFDPDLQPEDIFRAHREFEAFMPSAPARIAPPRRPAGKLRVGYVSADFRTHACAHFLLPLLRAHDTSKVEIFCYSNSRIDDAITGAFKSVASQWRSIHGLGDEEAARIVAKDEIDVLVDCSGHTEGNRLGVFARRPARCAVTWLGYGNTTGLKAVDYRFTDEILDPSGEDNAFATEKLIRLPHGFMTYDALAQVPAQEPPPVMARGHITFGSFNGLGKINRGVIGIWCRVLKGVPGSRLILKDRHFDLDDLRAAVFSMFSDFGIEADRCDLIGFTPERAGHLATMNRVDICLDSHPYGGNTTTCDAVLMGVPVVTLYGDRYTARQSASILHHLGLNDLIARDADQFVRVAASLASDKRRLADLRASLRDAMANSAIGNSRLFAASVETAYAAMVEGAL
jgi:predicted O-linked N-acetylglucosamine transferase (SPINDLY family)